ncbi:type II secretion system F family protein [Nonomuraea sp. NPDC046570]|uniref:type II secretion system F family protein n=1 Tax=Nonomuraea sp. NPDC046570 TaxID=3155255 RepID=UPI0033BFF60B
MAAIAALAAALAVWMWTAPTPAQLRVDRLLIGKRPHSRPLFTRPRPARRAEAWRTACIELCHALSAELAAGRTAGEALARAVDAVDFPDAEAMRPLLAAARDGGDVVAALVAASSVPGGEGLRRLAACWDVSVTVGAGLAALVDRVGASLRTAQAHRQDISAQLAGPRATARMLAGLPVLGLVLGGAMGMRPLDFLFGSLPGAACLVTGVGLNACGLWWTHRMAGRAENV